MDKLLSVIDIGEQVACDFCNEDYTGKPDVGGILFGTYGICPKCAPQIPEHKVTKRCPPWQSFQHFVLEIRGGDNAIKIYDGR